MPLPTEMDYIEFAGAGSPEVIRLASGLVPQPGPGKVLIQVVAFALNRGDCLQRAGIYPPPPGESQIPGLEVSGRVASLGDGVDGLAVGDEVCALVGSGAYAEYCVAEAALCLPRPGPVSLAEAAALPETAFTVYDNVFTRGRLAGGEVFLVHGGSSGIGSTAIQLARYFGATVIATAGSNEKCDFCRSIGADHAINYRTTDFVEDIKVITSNKGVDVILDSIGGNYVKKNLSVLAVDGRHVNIYFMQGSIVEIDLLPLMLKRQTITGSTLRPRTLAQKTAVAVEVRENVWPAYESGKVRPCVHATFTMADTAGAHALMESSAHMGKILVTVGE